MATIEEVNQTVADLIAGLNGASGTLTEINLKLDEIRTFIEGLQGGGPVSQQQLDALAALLDGAKATATAAATEAAAVLAEADALDE